MKMFLSPRIRVAATALAVLLLAPSLHADTQWASGVTLDEGWFDTSKAYMPPAFVVQGENNTAIGDTEAISAIYSTGRAGKDIYTDEYLCWAASASNILLYMQDQAGMAVQYTTTHSYSEGSDLVNTTVQSRRQYEVFETFARNYTDNAYNIENGILWYTVGDSATGIDMRQDAAQPAGGFCSQLVGTTEDDFIEHVFGTSVVVDFDNEYANEDIAPVTRLSVGADGSLTLIQGGSQQENVTYTMLFDEALKDGPLALSVMVKDAEIGHALTCWGYETDETDTLTKLYITDSDDAAERLLVVEASVENGYLMLGEAVDEAGNAIAGVTLYTAEGERLVTCPATDYSGWYVTQFSSFQNVYAAAIPEPASATLSLFALAGLAARRRRK